jgi:hypothetical protein
LGNAWILVDFLDINLGIVVFLHDAGEADLLPANAISSTAPAKEICRWGDHERGIRRTADKTPAGYQYEIGIGDDNNLQGRDHMKINSKLIGTVSNILVPSDRRFL